MISAAIVLPVPDGPANSAARPLPSGSLRAKPQLVEHPRPVPHPGADLAQLGQPVGRQDDVGPALAGGDAARQVAQPVAGVQARRRVQVRGGRRGSVGVAPPREVAGRRRRVPDPLTAEPELPGDRREILLLGVEAQTRQRVPPQPDPPAVVRSRELDPRERCAGQRVARFPGLLPGEEDRSGQVGEEGEEGAQLRPPRVRRQGVEARPAGDGVAQPGLAGGEPRRGGERRRLRLRPGPRGRGAAGRGSAGATRARATARLPATRGALQVEKRGDPRRPPVPRGGKAPRRAAATARVPPPPPGR